MTDTVPIHVSEELQQLVIDAGAACANLARKTVLRLAEADERAAMELYEATIRGDRLMLAVDLDTPDGLTRLITVGADQRITQHAAFGLFAYTATRN